MQMQNISLSKTKGFDVVFHFGGINFFNDIPRAIKEMIRVAKPGALIMIGDETQNHIDSWYCKIPFVKKFFNNTEPISPPIGLIPQEMVNIKMGYKWNDSMYMITFHKPTISSAVSYAAKTKDTTMDFSSRR